jgi:hypothetical protein
MLIFTQLSTPPAGDVRECLVHAKWEAFAKCERSINVKKIECTFENTAIFEIRVAKNR